MERLLIVLTRQGGTSEVGNANGVLYTSSGLHTVDQERSIWVIGAMGERTTWADVFNGLITQGKKVGVAIHCQLNALGATRIGEADALKGIEFLKGNYTEGDGGQEAKKYEAHKNLASCVRNGQPCPEASTFFDLFWNLCFSDPILEDLILLLKTHALAKANSSKGVSKADIEGISGYNTMSARAKEAISSLNGNSTYDDVRTALVTAVVEQESLKHESR